jgi:Sugar (pentulose and hexulose) kinases
MTYLGIDIGTGSSKGVLVAADGTVLRQARRDHVTATPRPGWFEHDGDGVWWEDFVTLCRELLAEGAEPPRAVCVSGIGPAVHLTDAADRPLRPAILYGIDTRCAAQAEEQNERIGVETLMARAGNTLSTQAVGPKLQWVAEAEPEVWARARRVYSAPGWLVRRLTGEYTIDHYSASNSDPLYDVTTLDWWEEAWEPYDRLERPRLAWPSEVVGHVTAQAAEVTGLAVGTPVTAGAIDALSEAYSAGCRTPGDVMVMYGSTLFMIQVTSRVVTSRRLWAASGRTGETFSLAAGMSTGGLVTSWMRDTLGQDYASLQEAAAAVPAGSDGLLLLPYFAGERTPVFDPTARAAVLGLTLGHGPGHLYRAGLEGVAMGVRHNLETMREAGASAGRLVAVGGGTAQRLWTQIVSDVTGLPQDLPSLTIGASYGDARMAADADGVDTSGWNPVAERVEPDPAVRETYAELFRLYLEAYPASVPFSRGLRALDHR